MTKYISLDEFQHLGYLQEANRLFFHRLGLALQITRCKHTGLDAPGVGLPRDWTLHAHSPENCPNKSFISGILDCRDDEEGFIFDSKDLEENGVDYAKKRNYIVEQFNRYLPKRCLLVEPSCDQFGIQII